MKDRDSIFILIIVGQAVAHIMDMISNAGRNFGIILVLIMICHLLNQENYNKNLNHRR